jgi:beta-glucosidase
MGDAWGAENYYFSSDVMLAPGINIHRSVLNGRNFEYYSEDPYLSGRTAANEIKGFQADKNVGMMVKHYAVNNQETSRSNKNTQVSTRALREIYLRNFEYAITEGEPWAVMDSYNQINSVSAAQNYDTNTTILRNEWGFKGFVSTDWGNGTGGYGNAGGIYAGFNNGNPIAANSASRVLSGNDTLQFAPDGSAEIVAAVANADHPLTQAHVDLAVRRLLEFVVKSPSFNNKPLIFGDSDQDTLSANRALGVEIGEEAVILLKNNTVNGKPALPLAKDAPGKVLSLGLAANSLVNGGGGSGTVNMTATDAAAVPQLNRAIENIVGVDKLIRTDATVTLTGLTTTSNERVISAGLQAAWTNDTDLSAVIYTLKRTSSEGSDINATTTSQAGNTGYNLHATETNIINVGSAIARAKNVPFIVVLNQGSWSNISSWIDKADAVVMGWNQGMAGGTPIARVLFGDVNPSGKTPTSVPIAVVGTAPNGAKYNPSEGQFGGSGAANPVYYVEDIYVGYRYFDTFNVPVSFPFGYGMSYTTYEYSDATLSKNTFSGIDDTLTASVKVTNTGNVAGKEIVQFYVGTPGVQMNKPVKELKGYGKTKLLQPGESDTITVEFDAMALASYSNKGATDGQWLVEKGHYAVYFAASSQDIRATKSFVVGTDFIAKTVNAGAAAPREAAQEYLDANAIKPVQITVTFKPLPGAVEGGSFQKAYSTMGASYGYLPELPLGYGWYIEGTNTKVTVDTVVTDGDKTLEAARDPFVLMGDGRTVKATIYDDTSTSPLTFIVALYDEKGKLIESRNSTAPANAYASGITLTLQGDTTGKTISAYLWDEKFVPYSKPTISVRNAEEQ